MIYYHIFLNKNKIAYLGNPRIKDRRRKYHVTKFEKVSLGAIKIRELIIDCFPEKVLFRTDSNEKENNEFVLYIKKSNTDKSVKVKNPDDRNDKCVMMSILGHTARRPDIYSVGLLRQDITLNNLDFNIIYYPYNVSHDLILPIIEITMQDLYIEIDGEIREENSDSFDDYWGWHSNCDSVFYTKRTRDKEGYLKK